METQPYIIKESGSTTTKLIVGGIAVVAIAIGGKMAYDHYQKNQSDKSLDTPEGQIALELKNLFNSTWVSDEKYKQIMTQVTNANSDRVRQLYKMETGRNLQDDEASHIGTGGQVSVAKQQVINSTAGSLIKIVEDKIQFEVGNGSLVRFPPGSTKPIPVYYSATGVATGVASNILKPSSKLFKVSKVLEVPYEALKVRDDWKQIFQPYLHTRKVFAAVQLEFELPNQKVHVWADAREFRTFTKAVHGLGKTLNNLL
jgi:hypothetical protein